MLQQFLVDITINIIIYIGSFMFFHMISFNVILLLLNLTKGSLNTFFSLKSLFEVGTRFIFG